MRRPSGVATPAASVGPVLGQVPALFLSRRASDHHMPDDLLVQVNLLEDRAPLAWSPNTHLFSTGLVELAEVAVHHPPLRIVGRLEPANWEASAIWRCPNWRRSGWTPPLGQEAAEAVHRPACTVRRTPVRSVAPQGSHLGRSAFPDPVDGRFTGFDLQLAGVSANVESQEVHPFIEVDDFPPLVLVSRLASGKPATRRAAV